MEHSSYLDLFDSRKRQTPYQSQQEADQEEENLLFVLIALMEKQQAGAVSMEFAAMDWEAARIHVKCRKKATQENIPAPPGQDIENSSDMISSVAKITRCFSLNRAEWLALLLAVAALRGRLSPGSLSRIRRGQKKDLASVEAAGVLGNFMMELESLIRLAPRTLLRPERLALFLELETSFSAAEVPMVLRTPVREEIFRLPVTERLGGINRPILFWKRKPEKNPPGEVFVYQEQLEQMKKMCLAEKDAWTLCLLGSEGSGKEFLAGHLAKALGRQLFVVESGVWEEEKKELALQEAFDFLGACLLSEPDALPYLKNPPQSLFDLWRSYLPGLVLVGKEAKENIVENTAENAGEGRKKPGTAEGEWVYLELPAPTASQKGRLWEHFLSEYSHTGELNPQILGSRYVLHAGGIRRVLYAAAKWAAGNGRAELSTEDIAWAVHQSQQGQLGRYAAEIPCVFSWDDLIVEPEVKAQLTYFCDQLKYRSLVGSDWGFFNKMPYGRGLCALFYGPPGTGKTMAVQVIARELGLDVYRVDLSRMVSKYIGETEKHISELFAKAKHMNVILFFDEADAFFSRRMEVKDANDRNANSEVAHLLQKLEEYDGVTILATNLKENMDEAFKRRIQFMVYFRLPSPQIRRRLWHSLLPPQAPRENDLALDFFAEHFDLSGSQIKEILLSAAYIAAGQGVPLGNRQLKKALCLNYEKYGKRLTEEDFGYLAYD